MKKWIVCVLAALLLTGCAAEETFETVADEVMDAPWQLPREVLLQLPEEAAAPASESEHGEIYQCDGYEIMVQTMKAGDLDRTLTAVSGYDRDHLTLLETRQGSFDRYDMVWACAGEQGPRLGRGAILDDGSYHYVLTVLGDADRAKEWEAVWEELFASFNLA